MEFEQFKQKIAAILQGKLGSAYQVNGEGGKGLNRLPPESICVRRKDTGASLLIKMDEYCRHHVTREGEADFIAGRIADFCEGRFWQRIWGFSVLQTGRR